MIRLIMWRLKLARLRAIETRSRKGPLHLWEYNNRRLQDHERSVP